MRTRTVIQVGLAAAAMLAVSKTAYAQGTTPTTTTMPKPPDEGKALVAGPKGSDGPKALEQKAGGVTATASAGGLFTTGNSRTTALTGALAFEDRFGMNSVSLAAIGNYAEGGKGSDTDTRLSAANIQARGRYDRFITERFGPFLMYTHRYDQLQGIDVRANIDPGFQYLVLLEEGYQLGLELGYDIQHDVRRNKARPQVDDKGNPVVDASGNQLVLDKTQTNHGLRLGANYKHAFNKEVTLQSTLEYLQPFNETKKWRMNFNALLAAKIAGGFAIGAGFNLLYDNDPLPAKKDLDTTTTIQLIYSFSSVEEKKADKCKDCPCEEKPAEKPVEPVVTPPPPVPTTGPAEPPPVTAPPPPPPADTTPAPAPTNP